MTFFKRISTALGAAWVSFRSHPRSPARWMLELFGGAESAAGVRVTADTAMQVGAVYACVRVLSETVGSLPLGIFQRDANGGKTPANKHPAWKLFRMMPNPEMTPLEFIEMMVAHVALRGNAFAQIVFDNAQRPLELWPLHPDRIQIRRLKTGELTYIYQPLQGRKRIFDDFEIVHVRGLLSDGIWGMSPILVAREVFGAAIATQAYGARFFANDATPGGVLEHPGKLDDAAHERLKKSWEDHHQGSHNARRPAILEQGMKFTTMGLKPEEAQFLQTRNFHVKDIARIFRVPPHLIQDLERATFSNVEQQSTDFVVHTIRPWVTRIEQAFNCKLIRDRDRDKFFFKFNVNALLRGDVKTRALLYRTGRQWGFLSANDIRALEDMNPLPPEVGDVYLSPLNMIPAEQSSDVLDDGDGGEPDDGDTDNRRQMIRYRRYLVKNGTARELSNGKKD